MDLNRLTRDADDLIRKVVSRYNQLYMPAGQISQLELDLMLDDMRKLYDTFKTIGHVNLTLQTKNQKPEVSIHSSKEKEELQPASSARAFSENTLQNTDYKQEKQHIPEESAIENEPEPTPEPEAYHSPELISRPDIETEFNLQEPKTQERVTDPELVYTSIPESNTQTKQGKAEFEEKFLVTEDKPNPILNPDSMPAMLADKFNTGSKSLSETIASGQVTGGPGSRLLFQPISDLSTGIGLNDKFSFITDLFGNNAGNYEEAITRINKAVNIDEAGWILQKYHAADWEFQKETLDRLKDFIKRRFI